MPAIMIILNIVLIAGIVVAIVGLCAWGIISDRPYATYLTNRALARAQQSRGRDRRRVPREASAYRGRAIDVGA
jgi:hypothetical protein